VLYTVDTDSVDGITVEGGQEVAAQGITDGNAETRLQGKEFELAELVRGLQQYDFLRLLKC
jgi:hypothetical protein